MLRDYWLEDLPIFEIKGTIKKAPIVTMTPAKNATNPPETAAFTFNVAAIATIIGIYIELQNKIPLSVAGFSNPFLSKKHL